MEMFCQKTDFENQFCQSNNYIDGIKIIFICMIIFFFSFSFVTIKLYF